MIKTIYIPRETCEEVNINVDDLVEDVVNNYKKDAIDNYCILEYFNDNIEYFINRIGLIDFDWDLTETLQTELSDMFLYRLKELYPELASDE